MKRLSFSLVGGLALFGLLACQVSHPNSPSALQRSNDPKLTIIVTLESACSKNRPLVITFEALQSDGALL